MTVRCVPRNERVSGGAEDGRVQMEQRQRDRQDCRNGCDYDRQPEPAVAQHRLEQRDLLDLVVLDTVLRLR